MVPGGDVVNDFHLIVTLIGALIMSLGLASARLSRGPLPPTLLALLLGVLVGPAVLDLVDPARLGEPLPILEGVARLTLGIGLVGVALRVPRAYPRRRWRDLSLLVGGGMLLMWAISSALVLWLLALPFWLAVLIGAMITATDPVAASPIVTGTEAERNIPEGMRHAISFESGANDGIAFLLVYLPFLILTRPPAEALSHWLLHTLVWDVVAATAIGVALGFVAARLLQAAEEREAIESQWRLVYMVALALFAVGAGRLIGSDEILIAFAAGATFVQVVDESERGEEERGQEAVNRFFAIPIFALVGTMLPWEGWAALGWRGPLLAAAVLLLRRPPVILALRPFLRDVRTVPGALFMGWFGPIAVAAAYYAALVAHRLDEPLVWHVVSLVVCASVIAHGVTGAPLTRRLGRTAGLRSRAEGAPSGAGAGREKTEPTDRFEVDHVDPAEPSDRTDPEKPGEPARPPRG